MFNRLRSVLDTAILGAALLAALLALLGLLGKWVPLFDLLNHFQLFILMAAIGGLIASFIWPFVQPRLKRLVRLLLLVPLACSLFLLGPEFLQRYLATAPTQSSGKTLNNPIKFMSYNIYLGTWDGNGLARIITRHDPDLVVLQEYAPRRFRNQPTLKKTYPYQARCQNWRRCTLSILSKNKLTELKRYPIGPQTGNNPMHGKMLAATMHVKGSPKVRVYTLHLAWPLPLAQKQTQIADAVAIIKREAATYPNQILAGDFNATGWSFSVDNFANEVGLERHSFMLPTFPSPNAVFKGFIKFPAVLSLDHILTSPDIKTGPVVRVASPIGDHWPIMTDLYLPLK